MMTRVRMRVSLVGPTVAVHDGDIYACDPVTAQRLIAEGFAEPLGDQAPTTMMRDRSSVERAVKPKAKARG